jgi:murein DD-endopeptidase MepM/ murein hydrolase activator NlpD
MLSITLNLLKHRLQVNLVKRRGASIGEPIFPDLDEIRGIKKGHKVSRFFRLVIENIKIKKILGANLAVALIATSLIPAKAFSDSDLGDNIIVESRVNLTTEKNIQYPLREVKITQGYRAFHPGIDLDGITGDKVRPIKPGMVEAISYSRYAYGNAVIVNHGEDLTSLYAHLSKISVKKGQEVDFETVLGEVGATGRSSGDHLHLEIRSKGHPVNPFTVLAR